jgi:hypothetical protein
VNTRRVNYPSVRVDVMPNDMLGPRKAETLIAKIISSGLGVWMA